MENSSRFIKGHIPWIKGRHHTLESNEKNRLSQLGKKQSKETIEKRINSRKGYKHLEETKRKIGLSNKGHKHTKETRKKISDIQQGKHHSILTEFKKGLIPWCKGKKMLESARRNMRIARIKYLSKFAEINSHQGKYEKEIIDKIQEKINFSIKRGFYIIGYFLDGYCQELNLAIEVDENHHFVNGILSQKDIERQKNIEEALHCKFLRIKESDYLKNKDLLNNILLIQ